MGQSIHRMHFFGDSLTAGYGALPQDGWVSRLEKAFSTVSCYNHGVCGAGVQDIFDEVACFLPRQAGELFFFMGGTNDILGGIRLDYLEKEVEQGIRKIGESGPLLLGIPPMATKESIYAGWQSEYNFERNQEDLRQYGEFLRCLARNCHLRYLDFSQAFPLADAWYSDGLHPNGKGYGKMAELACRVLEEELLTNGRQDLV